MSSVLYIKLREISEVHEKQVLLKDVAQLYSNDPALLARCKALKIKTIRDEKDWRYVEDVLPILEQLYQMEPSIQIENLGETDFIIDYQRKKPPRLAWQWTKTVLVSILCFLGAAFAIMTFNNDASVSEVFQKIYLLVLGEDAGTGMILEISYSVGLALGILIFFNHFSIWKLTTDPTPLEVEMHLYEDNISKTLIQNDGRKESGIDVT